MLRNLSQYFYYTLPVYLQHLYDSYGENIKLKRINAIFFQNCFQKELFQNHIFLLRVVDIIHI